MLKKKVEEYITKQINESSSNTIELFKEEKQLADKELFQFSKDVSFTVKPSSQRFTNVYIERLNKETEELIAEEPVTFLDNNISILRSSIEEFVYIESDWFDILGVDAMTLEVDDVFRSYNVLLGLKQQKKIGPKIKSFLTNELKGEDPKFSALFNGEDGLWDLNFALNHVAGFHEDMTLRESLEIAYCFMFQLVYEIEDTK